MMTKIEEVARAISAASRIDPDMVMHGSGGTGLPDVVHLRAWQLETPAALAALRALREPSEAMIVAASSGELDWGPGGTGEDATADKVWRAMIDAAIHEAETA